MQYIGSIGSESDYFIDKVLIKKNENENKEYSFIRACFIYALKNFVLGLVLE